MPIEYLGNKAPLTDPASRAYIRTTNFLVASLAGYQAIPGDVLTALNISRGDNSNPGGSFRALLYVSDVNDISTASLVRVMPWPIISAPNYTQHRTAVEPFLLTPGMYYWVACRNAPGAYVGRPLVKTHDSAIATIVATDPDMPSLAGMTFTSVSGGTVFNAEVMNLFARDTITLSGGQVAATGHIARDLAQYRNEGTMIRFGEFTNRGARVEFRQNGSFLIRGEGNHTFPVQFSVDGGTTWTTEQIVTVRDATVAPPLAIANRPPVVAGPVMLPVMQINQPNVLTAAQLLAGSSDPDGNVLQIADLVLSSGTATVTGVGPWVVTPTSSAQLTFAYNVFDGVDGVIPQSATALVNRPPVSSGVLTIPETEVNTGRVLSTADLLANIVDDDGDVLTITGISVVSGAATVTGSGPYTITASAAGTVTLSVTVSDGRGGSVTQTASMVAVVPVAIAQNLASFNGTSSSVTIEPWTPAGKYGVFAIFDHVPTDHDAYLLVDTNNRYISVQGNQGKSQFGPIYPTAALANFNTTKYFSAIVDSGKITFSDGVNDVTVEDAQIAPGSTYNAIGKRGAAYSNMSLSTIILFDYANEANSRVYKANASGQLLSVVEGVANPVNQNLSYLGGTNPVYIPPNLTNISSEAQWEALFAASFTGGQEPARAASVARTTDFGKLFAEEGQNWLQTFLTMHQVNGTEQYITRAKALVDYMFTYTDAARKERSEIHLTASPEDDRYVEAPKQLLYTASGGTRISGSAAAGWRTNNSGWRVTVETSGAIASGIARVCDYILSRTSLAAHQGWAVSTLEKLRPIIDEHDTSWSDTKNVASVGGYWFQINCVDGAQNANDFGDAGKFSNPIAFSDGLQMALAMSIVKRWMGGTEYNRKANAVLTFFNQHVWTGSSGERLWWHAWDVTASNRKTEDVYTAANIVLPTIWWLKRLGQTTMPMSQVVAMAKSLQTAEYPTTGIMHNRLDRIVKDAGDAIALDTKAQAVGQNLMFVAHLDQTIFQLAARAMRRYQSRPVANTTDWGVFNTAAYDIAYQASKSDIFALYDVDPMVANTAPTGTASINLGQANAGDAIEITAADLLQGISDADADNLTVVGLEIITGTGTLESVATNPPTVSGPVSLVGPIVGDSIVVEVEALLEGAVDPDGDQLSVRNFTVVSGPVTVSGTGPYTVTATGAGAVTFSYEITDGSGNVVAQTATMTTQAAPVLNGAVPTVSGFTGTAGTGETIRVSGTNFALSPTLLAIKGNEAAAGTKVADHAPFGLLEHGTVPDTWRFAGDGTILLTGQASDVVEVYKVFETKKHSVFAHYHTRYENVMAKASFPDGAQTKEARFSPNQNNLHSTGMVIGTGWNAAHDQLWIYTGGGSNTSVGGMTKEMVEQWHTRTTGAKVTNGVAVLANIVSGPIASQRYNENIAVAEDYDGFGNFLMPFFIRDGLTLDIRIRNLIVLDGYARVELGNRPNRAECTILDTQYAAMAGSDIDVNLDFSMFSSNDDIYLFVINEDNVYSNAIKIRDKVVVAYDRLADTVGLSRITNNGASYLTMDSAYAATVLEKDWVDYRIGFKVNSWASTTTTETNAGFSATVASASRGNLAVNRTTGAVTLKSQVNNVSVTVATINPATFLGNRYDWVLRIPKTTGEMIQLYNETAGGGLVLLGEVARPATFDNFAPERWMVGYASDRINGVFYNLGCFGSDGLTIFDFRLNEGSGLIAYSEGGVVAQATITQSGTAMSWVTA